MKECSPGNGAAYGFDGMAWEESILVTIVKGCCSIVVYRTGFKAYP